MSSPQRVTVLGSTGSVGSNTLDVMARHPERFQAFALTAATQVDALLAQCQRFLPRYAVMASETHAAQLQSRLRALALPVEVLAGPQALCDVSAASEVQTVMAAIVGAAGLAPGSYACAPLFGDGEPAPITVDAQGAIAGYAGLPELPAYDGLVCALQPAG